jgi:fatty-acyl-CoA synthase
VALMGVNYWDATEKGDLVKTMLVIGVADAVMGEELKACVVVKPDETVTAEEIKDWAGKSLAKFKVPRYVDFYDNLPRNASGKILKNVLKNQADGVQQVNEHNG